MILILSSSTTSRVGHCLRNGNQVPIRSLLRSVAKILVSSLACTTAESLSGILAQVYLVLSTIMSVLMTLIVLNRKLPVESGRALSRDRHSEPRRRRIHAS